jgi:hypothetical protein
LLGLGNSLHKNYQKYGADYREESKSFGLRWHSNSSVQESALDMSINAIDVTNNQQFQEIMRIHSNVDKERSVPRFFCFLEDENPEVFG